jgi:hypothetical protein
MQEIGNLPEYLPADSLMLIAGSSHGIGDTLNQLGQTVNMAYIRP